MTIDSRSFRATLGQFATGVAVATTRDAAGISYGVTVNSFASVSLDPPLVLFCLDKAAKSFEAFTSSGCFAVAVLTEAQLDLSRGFAASPHEPWEGLTASAVQSGAPVLRDALAWLDCATEAIHPGGDHVILVGRVLALGHADAGMPLVYWRGRYRRLDGQV